MRSLKHFVQQSWLLIVMAFVFGLLIAATNAALAPRIERNKTTKFTGLARGLLAEAKEFAPLADGITVKAMDGREETVPVYRALAGGRTTGWVFRAVGFGFADKIELVVAVDSRFRTVAGFDVLSSSETPGFGDQIGQAYFRSQFRGAPAERFTLVSVGNPQDIDANIVAITGATISSNAVVDALNHYVPQVKQQLEQKGLIGNDEQP